MTPATSAEIHKDGSTYVIVVQGEPGYREEFSSFTQLMRHIQLHIEFVDRRFINAGR